MTDRAALAAHLASLRGVSVLCVGDLMLDRFIEGEAERISPEAPVPVLRVERQAAMLGGAGNVARNLAALGARVRLVAVVGKDDAAREVATLAEALDGLDCDLIADPARRTAIKTRFLAGSQQLLRVDDESTQAIADPVAGRLVKRATAALAKCGAVVLSDYGKGTLTDAVIGEIVAAAKSRGVPVLVDPKGTDFGRYAGATVITPNKKELAEATGMATETGEEVGLAARDVIDRCGIAAVLVTRGRDGMTLLDSSGKGVHLPDHVPTEARDLFDVSGAGDTVIAAVAAALAAGVPLSDGARLANAAAGIVVGKTGTAVAGSGEIAALLHRQEMSTTAAKLVSAEDLRERVNAWRRRDLRIGFTNGCFDLLHPGHISLLRQAREACDRLIVGLNSDASAQRLKGKGRPIQGEAARADVLAGLASVDLVVVFGQDTPARLIEAIKPDVLVKGADYTVEEVVGADIVTAYGGRVLLAELEPGHSTTATIARMGQ